jgi:hypothetical protein
LFVTSEARGEKLKGDSDAPVGPVPANPFLPGMVFDRAVPLPGGPPPALERVVPAPEKP